MARVQVFVKVLHPSPRLWHKNFMNSLFFIAKYSIVLMYHIFCIHSSDVGHLGSFHLLAIINKAAMNIMGRVSLLHVGVSSGYMPRSVFFFFK